MKRSVIVISAILSFILFISCTKEQTCTVTEKDGVKTYRNKNIPSVEKLDFNPVKLFTLNEDTVSENYISYTDLDMIGADSEGNIYVGDMGSTPKVNKYDKNGKFLSTFVRLGSGPGEIGRVCFVCVSNDTVLVGDSRNGAVSLFDKSGCFIKKIQPAGYLFQVKTLGLNKFTSLMFNGEIIDGKEMMRMKITILNKNLETEKILFNYVAEAALIPDADQWTYTFNTDNKIYMGINDKNNYILNIYNASGELKEVVRKNYSAIRFEEIEIGKIEKYLNITEMGNINRDVLKNKRAIVGVYFDKRGHLIVQPSVDITRPESTDGITLDFFKDNIYLNTIKFKTEEPYYYSDFAVFLKFIGDKLFLIDSKRNIIEVYEY